MSQAKRPWKFDGHGINAANGDRIAKVALENYTYQTGLPVRNAEFDSISHLLKAAPELLEACEDLIQLWHDWAKDSDQLKNPLRRSIEIRVEQAQAAVNRAKGE